MVSFFSDPVARRFLLLLIVPAVLLIFVVLSSVGAWQSYQNLNNRWTEGQCQVTNTTSVPGVDGDGSDCGEGSKVFTLTVSLEYSNSSSSDSPIKLSNQVAFVNDANIKDTCFSEAVADVYNDTFKVSTEDIKCFVTRDIDIDNNTLTVVMAIGKSPDYASFRFRAIILFALSIVSVLLLLYFGYRFFARLKEIKTQPQIIHDIRGETGPGPTIPQASHTSPHGPDYI